MPNAFLNMDDVDDDAAVAATAIAQRHATRPVRVGRDASRIAGLSRVLPVDDDDDLTGPQMARELAARGITSGRQVLAKLDARSGRFQPPADPPAGISPLFSDSEVYETLTTDTKIKDIATVAISSTVDTTLDQLPCKWHFTDLTVGGSVLASGDESKVEIQIVLGTRVITKFRLDALRRTSPNTMVLDALESVYRHEIGPSSTVLVRVINGNAGVGMTFSGYLQYTFAPTDRAAMIGLVQKMVLV